MFKDYHAVMLRVTLDHIDYLESAIAEMDREIDRVMIPFSEARDRLDTIIGVGKRAAECIIAEIGVDMTRFPTAAHLASWAGVCPGKNITGGKRRSGVTNKGNRWLSEILNQRAIAASHTRDSYLAAQFWRLRRRIGHKKAAVAVGHSILVICWHLSPTTVTTLASAATGSCAAPTPTNDATTSSANSTTSATESPSPKSHNASGGFALQARFPRAQHDWPLPTRASKPQCGGTACWEIRVPTQVQSEHPDAGGDNDGGRERGVPAGDPFDDGLLAVEYARPPGRRGPGAGRPAKLYSRSPRELAVSLPQRDYELAGRLLAKAVTAAEHDGVMVGDALGRVARDTGRALGQQARQHAGARPKPSTLLAAAMTVLGESGYEPRNDGTSLTLVNCPFHGLAQDYTDLVCGMNLDLMTGLVEGLADPTLEARLEPTPGLCCVRLRRPDADTPQPARTART